MPVLSVGNFSPVKVVDFVIIVKVVCIYFPALLLCRPEKRASRKKVGIKHFQWTKMEFYI